MLLIKIFGLPRSHCFILPPVIMLLIKYLTTLGQDFIQTKIMAFLVYVLTIRIDSKGIKEELAAHGINQKITQILHYL